MEDEGILIDRKLNVALTRARKQLFITGNPALLSNNPVYRQLIGHIRSKGGYSS
jgi:superfamily I DNA and/or RNA helicase